MEAIVFTILVVFGIGAFVFVALALACWFHPHLYGVIAGATCVLIGIQAMTASASRAGAEFSGAILILGGLGFLAGSHGFSTRKPFGRPLLVWVGPITFAVNGLVGLFFTVFSFADYGVSHVVGDGLIVGLPASAVALLALWAIPFGLTSPLRPVNGGPDDAAAAAIPDAASAAPAERFRVVRVDDERHAITLEGAPENCVALDMAPPEREAFLGTGRWLVLGASIWNGPDREAIGRLLEAATHFTPETLAGVRPFKNPREFATWAPEFAKETRSPIWLVYDAGTLVKSFTGTYAVADLLRILPAGFTTPS